MVEKEVVDRMDIREPHKVNSYSQRSSLPNMVPGNIAVFGPIRGWYVIQ